MTKPKVSIIIPAYNIADYLPKCLDSLVKQTLHDIEIIVVNDASSDKSQRVIDRYRAQDSRIQSVINGNNKGLFLSRLEGLKYCNGQFVTFVDGDDFVEPKAYEIMYEKAIEGNYDIVACKINRIVNGEVNENFFKNAIADKAVYGQQILKGLLLEKISNSVGNKLYRREIINAVLCNELFVEMKENLENNGIKLVIEDQLFNFFATFFSKSYFMVGEPYYNYLLREGSLCTAKDEDNQKEWIRSAVHNFYILEKLLVRNGFYDDFLKEMEEMKVRLVVRRKRKVLSLFSRDIRTDPELFDKTVGQLAQYVNSEYILKHTIESAFLEISQLKKDKKKLLRDKDRMEAEQIQVGRINKIFRILALPKRVVKKVGRKVLRRPK